MWPDKATAPNAAVFASLSDDLATGRSALPRLVAASLLKQSEGVARTHRFFHWVLEFPEAYFDDHGRALLTHGSMPCSEIAMGLCRGQQPNGLSGAGIYRSGAGALNAIWCSSNAPPARETRGRIGVSSPGIRTVTPRLHYAAVCCSTRASMPLPASIIAKRSSRYTAAFDS